MEGGAGRLVSGTKLQLRRVEVTLGFVGEHNAMMPPPPPPPRPSLSLTHSKKSPEVWLVGARPDLHRSRIVSSPLGVHDPRRLLQRLARLDGGGARDAEVAGVTAGGGKGRAVAVLGDMLELGKRRRGRANRMLGRRRRPRGVALAAFFGPRSPLYLQRILFFFFFFFFFFFRALQRDPAARRVAAREPSSRETSSLVKGSLGMKLERVVERAPRAADGLTRGVRAARTSRS